MARERRYGAEWTAIGIVPTTLVIAWLAAFACAVSAAEGGSVAVLEVQFESSVAVHDHPGVGLADFLELGLLERGVEIYARRDLRLVLDERGLTRANWTRPEGGWSRELPWVDFLVKGWIRPPSSGQAFYTLEVSLADAQAGRIVDTWTRSIPRDESPAVTASDIAEAIARALSPDAPATIRERLPGFTTIPEVAAQFYAGLDHLLHERPGLAVDCFRRATEADPAFALASRWQAWAYEVLGLPEHAELVRAAPTEPPREPVGDSPQPEAGTNGAVRVVSLRFVNGPGGAFDAPLITALRAHVRRTPGVEVFEAEWLRELANESDLKLTGEFSPLHGLDRRLWLHADFLIAARVSGASPHRTVDLTLADLRRGRIVSRVRADENRLDTLHAGVLAALAATSADACRMEWQSQQDAPYRYTDYRNRRYFEAKYSAADFACAVEGYARAPHDRAKLLMLYWCFPPSQPEHRHVLMRRLAESVVEDEQQGDVWLAYALMQMHALEQVIATRGGPAPLPLAERLASFRRRYTKGIPAFWADYAVGQEVLCAGDAPEAQRLLNRAAKGLLGPLRQLARREACPRLGDAVVYPVRTGDYPFLRAPDPRAETVAAHLLLRAAEASARAGEVETARRQLAELDGILRGEWTADCDAVRSHRSFLAQTDRALWGPWTDSLGTPPGASLRLATCDMLGIVVGLRAEDGREYQEYVLDHAWLGWTIAPATLPAAPAPLIFAGAPHTSFGEAVATLHTLVEAPDRPLTPWPVVAEKALAVGTDEAESVENGVRYLDHVARVASEGGVWADEEQWHKARRIADRLTMLAADGPRWARCADSLTNLAAHAPEPDWRDYFEQSAATPAADLTPRHTVRTEPVPPSWWPARTSERLGNPHLVLAVLARNGARHARRGGPEARALYYARAYRDYARATRCFVNAHVGIGVGVDVRDRWFCLLWPAVKQAQFAIVAAAGPMLEDAGAASALYDEVLADTELGRPEFAAWRLTFLYRLAESAARRGNPARAVDLLKGVVEIPYADDIPLMRLADVATPADSSQGVQTAARALLGRIRDTAAAEQGREDSAQEGGGSLP